MKKILITLCVLLFSSSLTLAQEGLYGQLITNYAEAIQSRDERAIVKAWEKINKNKDAEDYLNANYPWIAYSYKFVGLSIKLSKSLELYKEQYGEGSVIHQQIMAKQIYGETLQTNQEAVLSSPNDDQMSLLQTLLSRINAPFITNRETTMRMPNQNQRSNQEAITSRLERLYGP